MDSFSNKNAEVLFWAPALGSVDDCVNRKGKTKTNWSRKSFLQLHMEMRE